MPTTRVKKSDANKQKEVTAQSFKRIAKALRAYARITNYDSAKGIARIFDAEARLLRSMR